MTLLYNIKMTVVNEGSSKRLFDVRDMEPEERDV